MEPSFLVLILAFVVAVAVPLSAQPHWREWVGRQLRKVRPWHVVVACLLLFVVMVEKPAGLVLAASAALLFLFGLEWRREFTFLMELSDDDFPGRNDKLIWAILLIVLAPVGVWLFRAHRLAHWPDPKKVSGFEEL